MKHISYYKRILSFLTAVIMSLTLCLPAAAGYGEGAGSLETATVTVNYYWKDSEDTMIHEPYIACLPIGREYNIPSPDIPGFKLADDMQSEISGTITEDESFSVYYDYAEDEYAYTVYYVGSDSLGKNVELGKFEGKAPIGKVAIPFKEFSGWEREGNIEDMSLMVTSDGEAQAIVRYKKLSKPYIIFQTGGSYIEPIMADPGADISEEIAAIKADPPERQGYKFEKWDIELPDTMPGSDLIITAEWTPVSTPYTVLYWFQNIEDDDYSLNYGLNETRYALTGTEVTATVNDINKGKITAEDSDFYGFDYSHADTGTVKADGSGVVNIYYDREIWTINIYDNPLNENMRYDDYAGLDRKLWKSLSGKYGSSTAGKMPSWEEVNKQYGQNPFEGMNYNYINLMIADQTDRFKKDYNPGSSDNIDSYFTFGTFTIEGIKGTHNVDLFPFYSSNEQGSFYISVFGQSLDDEHRYDLLDQKVAVGAKNVGVTYLNIPPFKGFTNVNGWHRMWKGNRDPAWENNEDDDAKFKTYARKADGTYVFYGYDWNEFRQQRVKNTLTFKSNDDIIKQVKDVYYETPLDLNMTPEKGNDGMRFAGWYLDPQLFNSTRPVTSYKMPETDLTFYAKWAPVDVTVTFDTQGGNSIEAQSVPMNSPAALPETPIREGYLFTGWYLNTEGDEGRWSFDRPVNEDITLYAHWQKSAMVGYTVDHIIKGEEKPFYSETGKGYPGDGVYVRALTPTDKKYPEGTYLEPEEAGSTLVLKKGGVNTKTVTYTRVGEKEYTVAYLDEETKKPIRKMKSETTLNTWVTEIAPEIDGYICLDGDGYEVKKLSKNEKNEIVFYYHNGDSPVVDPETGGLTVSKTVSGDEADKNEKFLFRVTLGDETINGKYGEMDFKDGVAEFMLSHEQSITAKGLPENISYKVEELQSGAGGDAATPSEAEKKSSKKENIHIHDEECGYREAQPELPCSHIHDESCGYRGDASEGVCAHIHDEGCYKTVKKCLHPHKRECYPEEDEATASNAKRRRSGEPSECTHVCSEENGCIKKELVCTHEHDESCGYKDAAALGCSHIHDESCGYRAAVPGTPCKFETDGEESADTFENERKSGYKVSSHNAEGAIQSGKTVVAAFNNHKGDGEPVVPSEVGSLEISKTVSGKGASRTRRFAFTVTLKDDKINGSYGDLTFNEGVAELSLSHGQKAVAENLPAGVKYTVAESENEGYTVTAVGDTGIIPSGTTAEASFNNYKGGSGGGGGGGGDGGGDPVTPTEPDDKTDPEPATPSVPDRKGSSGNSGGSNVRIVPDIQKEVSTPSVPVTPPAPIIPSDHVPKTGDESGLSGWILALVFSALGMGATLTVWIRSAKERR